MFKKLKDKIGEEFKQGPSRLSASVQQIAQVISPSASTNSLPDNKGGGQPAVLPDAINVSSDLFSIYDEQEMDDSHRRLQTVELTASSPSIMPSRSRRDSVSSVASDASSLYPIYESPLNHSTLQSEWESEIDETTTTQLERVSKEQLYQGYKKLLYRYNKYKGRFLDLQREHVKTKNVLQESQDKALRRIAELREQCQLEQTAKAHLEESLRNDLEERDHLIATLNTKIKLLRTGSNDVEEETQKLGGIDTSQSESNLLQLNLKLTTEVERLKKLAEPSPTLPNGPSIEPITEQVKETITQLKSGIVRMKSENENLSQFLSKSPSTSDVGSDSGSVIDFSSPEVDEKDKKIEKLGKILLKCKEQITNLKADLRRKDVSILELTEKVNNSASDSLVIDQLREEIKQMKVREDDNVRTIAENKMAIHQELEAKEKQIEKLTQDLDESRAIEKEIKLKAEEKLSHYEQQIRNLQEAVKKATEVKNDALERLKVEVESNTNTPQLDGNTNVDIFTLEKEKERFSANVETFLQHHQNKINHVLNAVDIKLANAEGNLARVCADRLIASRATELMLSQQISELQNQATKLGIECCKIEDLEKEVKILEVVIDEKEKMLQEKTKTVESLNSELNDKIDRIVVLGAELEEVNEKHKFVMESLEIKCENLTKLKRNTDEEIDQLHSKITALQAQDEILHLENSKYEFMHEQSELKSKEISANIEKLELCILENGQKINELTQEVSQKSIELEGYVANLQRSDEEKIEMKIKIKEMEQRLRVANENCDKIINLENELAQVRSSSAIMEDEKNKLAQEKEDIDRQLMLQLSAIEEVTNLVQLRDKEIEELKYNIEINRDESKESKLSEIIQQKNDQVEELSSKLSALEDEKLKMLASVEQERNVENCKLREEITKLEAELKDKDVILDTERMKFFSDVEKLQADFATELDSIMKQKVVLEEEINRVRESSENYHRISTKLEEATENENKLLEKFNSISAIVKERELELATKSKELEEIKSKCAAVICEVEVLSKAKEEMELKHKETLNSSESRLNAITEDHSMEISKLHAELESARKVIVDKRNTDADLAKIKDDSESKVNILKNEIKYLNDKFEQEVGNIERNRERETSELREKLEHSEKMASELMSKLESAAAEKEELSQLFNEKSLKVAELESCLSDLKIDLDRNFNETTSKVSSKDFEEVYEERLQKIVSEYELQILKREEMLQEAELELSENKDALESLALLRAELKNLRNQLIEKDEALDKKIEELELMRKESENKIINAKIDNSDILEEEAKKFEKALKAQREEFEESLVKEKEKFEHLLVEEKKEREHSIKEEKEKNQEKMRELQEGMLQAKQEWVAEKKEWESTSKIAVAAVGSSTESMDMLRKEIMCQAEEIKELKKQHKREVLELSKLVALRSRRPSEREREGEDVEHEYLRNILYEYMMGREQMVLAKVLAAIVKFDHQQTHNVLERQASVGSLRIL